ncbi:PucR family transcriptional regulator [Siminovitchia sediminis]|uniref:PucR family transcriptional regulator n=1 Tax=Siminovitchia sediminis TaxID=1274353 RepID=A0ABW4KK32_9BACI
MRIIEMLELPAFKEVTVLTENVNLEKDVLGITLFDAPDGYEWFREGEFIITTGYPFMDANSDWEETLIKLIKVLINKKCSGLGIKIGRYILEIPSKVISYASENEFPILHLPNRLAWSDLIVPVVTYINNKQRLELELTRDVYENFHAFLTNGKGLPDLANLLHKLTSKPIAIYIKTLNIYIEAPSTWISRNDVEDLITNVPIDKNSYKLKEHEYQPLIRLIKSTLHFEAAVIIGNVKADLKPWELVAIEQAVTIIKSEIERLRSIATIYQRQKNTFITKLQNGVIKSYEVLLRLAQEIRWKISNNNFYAVLLNCDLQETNEVQLIEKKLNIIYMMEKHLEESLPGTLIGFDLSNRFVLLIEVNNEVTENLIIRKLKELITTLNISTFYGGIGRAYPLLQIRNSFKEAETALNFSYTKESYQNQLTIYSFSELNIERILYSNNPLKESETIADEYLNNIIEYDKKKNSELFITLKVFLENNASHIDTAKALYIHKNTVRYRLKVIREITGLDPENIKDQILFVMALSVVEISEPKAMAVTNGT